MLRESEFKKDDRDFLVQGFRNGFSIGYNGREDVQYKSPNLKLEAGDYIDLWNKVMKEVKLKRYAGPFSKIPFKNFIQSPIGLVPKDGGADTRLIFHLSYPRRPKSQEQISLNANTPKHLTKVKYPDFLCAIKRFIEEGDSCYGAKSDMRSAFRNLGIKKKHWKYLVMKAKSPIDGKWYYFVDKCLPFGAAISCAIFQKFSNSIAHLVGWKVRLNTGETKLVVNYLDDFLFAALKKILCDYQVNTFLKICEQINFPVSMEKTIFGTTQLTFLGLLVDTIRKIVAIPEDKLTKAMNMILSVLNKKSKKITVLRIEKICGFLNFLSKCVLPGRTFTRRLYAAIKPGMKQHHHININGEMRMDLEMWLSFITHPTAYCRSFIDMTEVTEMDELTFFSDASKNQKLGFGAICQNS